MNSWRVTTITNPHGSAYALDPWDSMTVEFLPRQGTTLSCVDVIDERKRVTTEYRITQLDEGCFELIAPEIERRAILAAFSRYYVLDRSWLEEGEPEVWELTLELGMSCILQVQTIYLSLRG